MGASHWPCVSFKHRPAKPEGTLSTTIMTTIVMVLLFDRFRYLFFFFFPSHLFPFSARKVDAVRRRGGG